MKQEEIIAEIASFLRQRGKKIGIEETIDALNAWRIVGDDDEILWAAIKAALIKDRFLIDRPKTFIRPSLGEVSNSRGEFPSSPDSQARNLHSQSKAIPQKKVSIYSSFEKGLKPKAGEVVQTSYDRYAWRKGTERLRLLIQSSEGHRFRRNPSGEISLKETLRIEGKRGGESMEIVRSAKKINKSRAILLCDISGSMKDSLHIVSNLCYWLKRTIPASEIFLFSTRIKRATRYAESLSPEEFQLSIPRLDIGYGSGTRIGQCLHEFRRTYGSLMGRKTAAIIFSDGWDIGDVALLENEMKQIHRSSLKVIWINPLLEYSNYSPETRGMKACLSHIDLFLSPSELILGRC